MSDAMSNEEKKYEKYARTIKQLFLVAGLWPGAGSNKYIRLLVVLYTFIASVILSANINFIVNNLTNVSQVTKTMGISISGFGVILKVSLFTLNRDNIKRTHDTLELTFRKDFENPVYRDILLSPLVYFYRPTIIMARTFIMIPSIYCMAPLLSIIIQRVRGAETIEYHTLFLTKYPWDSKGNIPIYLCHYFIESIGAMGVGFISASVDAALGFYIFQIATQFRVLSYRLTCLKPSDDYRSLVRECVTRRRVLVECCDCLERVYGPIVLWFMITSAISLCANVYQMSKMSSESIAAAVLYIVSKLAQSLFYAWFGSFLTTEMACKLEYQFLHSQESKNSENLFNIPIKKSQGWHVKLHQRLTESFRDAVYGSGWPGSGEIPFMTSILIMLMWKPIVLTACNFSTISLDMFVAIINTAVSYFFLLQTIEEGK